MIWTLQHVPSLLLPTLKLELKLEIWHAMVFQQSQLFMVATKWRPSKWILKKLSAIFLYLVRTVTRNVFKNKSTVSSVKEPRLTIKDFLAVSVMVLDCLILKALATWSKLFRKRSKPFALINLEFFIKSIFWKRTKTNKPKFTHSNVEAAMLIQ